MPATRIAETTATVIRDALGQRAVNQDAEGAGRQSATVSHHSASWL